MSRRNQLGTNTVEFNLFPIRGFNPLPCVVTAGAIQLFFHRLLSKSIEQVESANQRGATWK